MFKVLIMLFVFALHSKALAESFSDVYTGSLSTQIDSDVKVTFKNDGTLRFQILEEWRCKNLIGPGDLTWYHFPGVTLQGTYNYDPQTRNLFFEIVWDGNVRATNDTKISLDFVSAGDSSVVGSSNRNRLSGRITMGSILCEAGECYLAGGFFASIDVTNGDPDPTPTPQRIPSQTETSTNTLTPTWTPTDTPTMVPTPSETLMERFINSRELLDSLGEINSQAEEAKYLFYLSLHWHKNLPNSKRGDFGN